ncbi:hypothetical protein VTO58DRAFT_106057 [Aureobasidium pullulans]|nr:hypothetical protein D6C80_08842 [Aureobasidium pullulans]
MAILDSLPGVEITVVVDGEDLHEYQDADMEDEENTVTKYVEAVTGANFTIKIMVPKKFGFEGTCLSFHVLVDGAEAEHPLIQPRHVRRAPKVRSVEGARVSNTHIRKFRFTELETVNDHGFGLPKDLERVKELGYIRVEVFHKTVKNISKRVCKELQKDEGFISEKAIKGKAISHAHSLDSEQHEDKSTLWKTQPIIGDEGPRGTFLFHYRSKDSLRQMLIIPRTPSPVPLRNRPIAELNEQEKAELIEQLLSENAEKDLVNKRIKRELSNDDDNNSHTNKRVRTSIEPVSLELNDDDTFTEVTVVHKEKEKEVIALD